jgi:hypothetical protein
MSGEESSEEEQKKDLVIGGVIIAASNCRMKREKTNSVIIHANNVRNVLGPEQREWTGLQSKLPQFNTALHGLK